MYASFYKLSEKPFQINTDPRFLWLGEKHREALANLKYGLVDRNGLVVLTGDIGTGKTTLVNALLDSLDDKVCVAKINHTSLEPDEFLSLIAKTFDPYLVVSGKSDVLLFFNSFLKKEHADGKTVLLIVDEAHRLSAEIMEEIRLLTNIEQAGKSLLSIIFVGQNELMPILQSPQCRALRQRITQFYAIETLTGEETALYMQHRLRVSGAEKPLFSPAAITKIYTYTKGYPRMINILCDRALLTGFVKGAHLVDEDIITECAGEIDLLRKKSAPLFWTKVNQMRSRGASLLMCTAKAGAKIKPRIKAAIEYLSIGFGRWHSKWIVFAKSVLSRSGRFMARHRRNIVMGLAASALTFLLATWTIQALSVADDPERNIALKHPEPAVAEPAPPFGNQEQKAATLHQDMPTMDAAESASLSSKPEVQPEATTAEDKTFTDKDAASAPNSFPPVQATQQEQVDTAPAEDNFKRVVERVEASGDGEHQVQDNFAWPYAWALMGRVGEIMAQSSADAEQLLLKVFEAAPGHAQANLMLGTQFIHTQGVKSADAPLSTAAGPKSPPAAMQALREPDNNIAPQPRESQKSDEPQEQYQQKHGIEAPSKPPIFSHKVKWSRETLYSIALWYTGSGERWKQIAEANPSITSDQIHIGDNIAIPLSLIKTQQPMPSVFLKNRKKAEETAAAIQHSTPVEPL